MQTSAALSRETFVTLHHIPDPIIREDDVYQPFSEVKIDQLSVNHLLRDVVMECHSILLGKIMLVKLFIVQSATDLGLCNYFPFSPETEAEFGV